MNYFLRELMSWISVFLVVGLILFICNRCSSSTKAFQELAPTKIGQKAIVGHDTLVIVDYTDRPFNQTLKCNNGLELNIGYPTFK